jgi:AbrB family looped-hinge helix DNA binding protein
LSLSYTREADVKSGKRRSKIVRSSRNGQITIPAEFRRELGIQGDTPLQLTLTDGELRIKPVPVSNADEGSPWLKELYDLFAPVREEARQFSEEEINATIDDALRAVRSSNAERRL